MWPRTDLIDRLEIEHPLLQAPMGGESTPEMAIAVGNAGGLATEQADEAGFEFYLWGQAAAFNRECSSADLVQLLVREAQDALHSAAGTKA